MRAEGLGRTFGSFVAVNRISFEVRRGEIFGFLGPNGAGKSTTIRMLCGILKPTSGRGTVAGFDLGTEAEQIKARIGYMSQRFSLYDDLRVEENIDFYSGIYGIAPERRDERKQWVLEMAGLREQRRRLTSGLAGGWKQRLALGCALIHSPEVLFLDEPTSGVDPPSRRRFWDLIDQLSASGVTVFVTTHYLEEAEHCGRVGLIYAGDLIACDTPDAFRGQMRQQVIEILCDKPGEALEVILGAPGVARAALFGQGLHVTSTETAPGAAFTGSPGAGPESDWAAELKRFLAGRGIDVERARRIPPTMEDVFMARIHSHDAAAAAVPAGGLQ